MTLTMKNTQMRDLNLSGMGIMKKSLSKLDSKVASPCTKRTANTMRKEPAPAILIIQHIYKVALDICKLVKGSMAAI